MAAADEGSRMTDTPKDPVAEYIEGMRAWRAEFEALRPVLLGAGLEGVQVVQAVLHARGIERRHLPAVQGALRAAVLQGRAA